MAILILFLGLYISLVDLKTHRISHRSLLMLLLLLLPPFHFYFLQLLISLPLLFTFTCVWGMGAGDLKLLMVLIATRYPILLDQRYMWGFIAVTCLVVAMTWGRRREGRVALGPSIVLPFAVLNLGF
jgi:Flp pilus assembly protein protease CpaA